jgi:hypothetical protein
MPFTFSHPAIVMPFIKIRHKAISMSGLVVGSLTPDFEYMIRMKLGGRYGHSIEGMFLLDLPIAFLAAIIFHQLVKKPLIDSLPTYFYARLLSLRNFNFPEYLGKHYLFFSGCLLVGIASHILWDSFTHDHGYFVERLESLSMPVVIDGLPELPLFKYIQHSSTVIGGSILILVFHQLPSVQSFNSPSLKFWVVVILIAGLTFAARAALTFEYFGDIVVSTISSALIGLIISSAIFLQSKLK